jgi:hypothetical protein
LAGRKARLPPRWFIKTFWHVHGRIVRASRGRKGLWPPRPRKWGCLTVHHDRPTQRQAAKRDPRLLRGRAQPRLDGDEWLGRGRAGLVAEPAGRIRRRSSSWQAGSAARCAAGPQSVPSVNGCGSAGVISTGTSRATQPGARESRRSSCSSRALRRNEPRGVGISGMSHERAFRERRMSERSESQSRSSTRLAATDGAAL